ncbi:MAG: hypothetical protein QG608_1867 [Actinomycetota bacterium]|nr:hypothetical protein [Actinomycetota bacterium]
MQERDLLMDGALVERFLEGETSPEENAALAHAMARYFPRPPDSSPEDFPPDISERVNHIINSLGGFAVVDVWMLGVPGLPRFMANISRLEDTLYGLPSHSWTVKGLGRVRVPEDLEFQWRKNDDRGGADELGETLGDLIRERTFPEAGRLAERVLQILLDVAASGEDSPEEREELTAWCTEARALLREDAAGLGFTITPQTP